MKQPIPKRRFSAARTIVFFYLCCVLAASLLLYLPVFHRPGASLTYINALFTAASAISVTGLSVIPIHEVFNPLGIFLLTVLFQIGGIGIMTAGTLFWLLTGQKIGLEHRMWIAMDHNRPTLSGLVSLMRRILLLTLYIELAGTLLLSMYFYAAGYQQTWYHALYHGYFASVAAFTNAGFDLHGTSLIGFAGDYFVQSVSMLLIILGAIGFPVLIEVGHYLGSRPDKPRFSLFTKITTLTFLSLVVLGALFFYLFEREGVLADKSWHATLFYSLFQSVSSRSGGMVTLDLSLLGQSTLLLLSGLMFIGASPGSVGGGIRTTTFFILLAVVAANLRGHKDVKVFKRELRDEDIRRSFTVFFVGAGLIFAAVLILLHLEDLPFQHILFEVSSAFGTTGMSTGITPLTGTWGKLVLITMMVIGRIGILTLLLFLKKRDQPADYHYPKEQVSVGQ